MPKYIIIVQIIAGLFLLLTVAALIVVFAVESSWFHDNFNGNSTQYGLWRLCFPKINCFSWFSNDATANALIERRLDQSRAGINGWQALEIIFLFLSTASLFTLMISIIVSRLHYKIHYYLSVLTVCSIWPAVMVGITVLFVFGFTVYNVSQTPRGLDWCFYVNLVAVILCIISAILLTIYLFLLRKPKKNFEDDAVIESFPDLGSYPNGMSPSTFVIVRRDKKNRNKPYDYPQVLRPNVYSNDSIDKNENFSFSNRPTSKTGIFSTPRANLQQNETNPLQTRITNPQTETQSTTPVKNRPIDSNPSDLIPSASFTTMGRQPTNSFVNPRFQQTSNNFDLASSMNWRRSPPINPFPLNQNFDRPLYRQSEPKVLHYYTGLDYFATVDPSDSHFHQYSPRFTANLTPRVNYNDSGFYNPSSDWLKSTI